MLSLVETKVAYVVQEAVIVTKDIFRRYPGKYEGIIPTLCENLDLLDEPESKAAMIWILGQFSDKIDNADELLDDLLYTFLEESVEVCTNTHFCLTDLTKHCDSGSTCITDRIGQTFHIQIKFRQGEGAGAQSSKMDN